MTTPFRESSKKFGEANPLWIHGTEAVQILQSKPCPPAQMGQCVAKLMIKNMMSKLLFHKGLLIFHSIQVPINGCTFW